MPTYARYAIFAVPEGAFFETASNWLGWNSVSGSETRHPNLPNLPDSPEMLTATPRKYGFHGTLKPPFRLAEGLNPEDLETALEGFCALRPAVTIPRLVIKPLGGFVSCVPETPCDALADLAASTVAGLDPFRAPAPEEELARRRKTGLSARQERMLQYWGYPYVFDEFRFHLTLSGKLERPEAEALAGQLNNHFSPVLPESYMIRDLCLLRENADGRFQVLRRYELKG